jgi:dual specificity protein kinase YAK1
LGQGTFGQVFRCQHVTSHEVVAIKIIRNHPSYFKQANVEVRVAKMVSPH